MSWSETFRTAVEALLGRRMRSLLTMLGILIGIAAIGMTFVLLTAGIDLSVGSVLYLAPLIAGFAMRDLGIGVAGGLHVLDPHPRQFAVARPGAHVEIDVAGAVVGGVRMAALDQLADQLGHLRDVAGGPRFVGRRDAPQCGVRLVQFAFEAVRPGVPGLAGLG